APIACYLLASEVLIAKKWRTRNDSNLRPLPLEGSWSISRPRGSFPLRPRASGYIYSVFFPYDGEINRVVGPQFVDFTGVPNRIRTGDAAVKGRCPRPLD